MRVSIMTGLFVLFGVGALAVEKSPLTEVSLQFQMLRLNKGAIYPSKSTSSTDPRQLPNSEQSTMATFTIFRWTTRGGLIYSGRLLP